MWKDGLETELSMRNLPQSNQSDKPFLLRHGGGRKWGPLEPCLRDSSRWKDRAWEDVSCPPPHTLMSINDFQSNKTICLLAILKMTSFCKLIWAQRSHPRSKLSEEERGDQGQCQWIRHCSTDSWPFAVQRTRALALNLRIVFDLQAQCSFWELSYIYPHDNMKRARL